MTKAKEYKIAKEHNDLPMLTSKDFRGLRCGDVIRLKGVRRSVTRRSKLVSNTSYEYTYSFSMRTCKTIDEEFIFDSQYLGSIALTPFSSRNQIYVNTRQHSKYGGEHPFYGTIERLNKNVQFGNVSGHKLSIVDDRLIAGCQSLSAEKTLELWKNMGRLLGYDIEG